MGEAFSERQCEKRADTGWRGLGFNDFDPSSKGRICFQTGSPGGDCGATLWTVLAGFVLLVPAFLRLVLSSSESVLSLWLTGFSAFFVEFAFPALIGTMAIVCGKATRTREMVAATFFVLSLIGVLAFAAGIPSCGCLPGVDVAPLLTSGFSLVAALVFVLISHGNKVRFLCNSLCWSAGGLLLLAAFSIVFNDLEIALFRESVAPVSRIATVKHREDSPNVVVVPIYNHSSTACVISGVACEVSSVRILSRKSLEISPFGVLYVSFLVHGDRLPNNSTILRFYGRGDVAFATETLLRSV
jgi:hypothetical protein